MALMKMPCAVGTDSGNHKIIEGQVFVKVDVYTGMQIIYNENGGVSHSPSIDWTGDYLQYTDSTGLFTVLQPCKVMIFSNGSAPTFNDYAIGDTFYGGWSSVTIGSNISIFVIG